MTVTLPRIACAADDFIRFKNIETKLGYHGLIHRPFLRQLIGAGVTPFDPQAVAAYKAAKLKEMNRPFRRKYEWHAFLLGGEPEMSWAHYNDPIPLNVLDLAARLKDALPGCDFMVDALRLESRPAAGDPFLIVTQFDRHSAGVKFDRGEKYHLAVWDEPTFMDISMED